MSQDGQLFSKADVAKLKPLNYPSKILLAWGEAIEGNAKIREWLMKNGYPELAVFTFALRNQDDARLWLVKNGYAHLLALINGAEGNKQAIEWLLNAGYDILANMARSIDWDEAGHRWLLKRNHRLFALLAKKMKVVKDIIDDDNNDPHQMNFY